MAPINCQNSYSAFSSSSSSRKTPYSCMCRGSLSDDFEWFLPITRRGQFFQDSFFENSRSHFDTAIRDVLGKWGDSSMLKDDWHDDILNNFSRYRQLRSSNMREDNQAVTVSSDSSSHKIVLDVHEFADGDVKVKVIGEKEILIEGFLEEGKARLNRTTAQEFSRKFPVPHDSDIDAISSVMSSEGILTITIPKKGASINQEKQRSALNSHISSNNTSQETKTSASKNTQAESYSRVSSNDRDVHNETNTKERYCECCYKKLQAEKNSSGEAEQSQKFRIPIKIDTSLLNNQSSRLQESQNNENFKVSNSKCYQRENSSQQKEECYSTKNSHVNSSQNREAGSSVSKDVTGTSLKTDDSSRNVPISVNFCPLPITRRGRFFDDSFFESARNDFQSAISEVLSNWGERSSILDDLSCYRNLRTRDLREDTQAIKVTEDETNHKFVLDVHDFINGGEVNVKAVNDRELVVEGQVEKQEGGSKSVKRFFKRFVVPSDILLSSVTSVMSSDGVLTITAPKQPATIQIRDVTSPQKLAQAQESQLKDKSVCEQHSATKSSESTFKNIQESSKHQFANLQHNSSNQQAKEHIIPMSVEGTANQCTSDRSMHMEEVSNENNQSEKRAMNENMKYSAEKIKSEVSESSTIMSPNIVEITNGTSNNSEEVVQTSAVNKQNQYSENQHLSLNGRSLPISKKGAFFHDSFFEESRQNFQSAVKNVLQKFNENVNDDAMTSYRGLRQRCLTEESQAVNVHEDESSYKVTLEAKDFIGGDINVSIVDERELLIEGRTEKKEGSASSSQTFCRRFLLPDNVDIDSISSAISSDGVLTVKSAKTGSVSMDAVQKTSSEAQSRKESHNDSGHQWEENSIKESSEQSDGYSSKTVTKSYRSHMEQNSKNVF